MLLNWGVVEDSWEFLGLQGIQPVHPKGNQSWIFIGRIDVAAETHKEPTHLKRPWCWERLKAGGEGDNRDVGWHHQLDGHEWVSPGSWRWTGKPGVLQSMGSQKVSQTRLRDWTEVFGSLEPGWKTRMWGSAGSRSRSVNSYLEEHKLQRGCGLACSCYGFVLCIKYSLGKKKGGELKQSTREVHSLVNVLFKFLFIFGCAGSSLLHSSSLWFQWVGTTL